LNCEALPEICTVISTFGFPGPPCASVCLKVAADPRAAPPPPQQPPTATSSLPSPEHTPVPNSRSPRPAATFPNQSPNPVVAGRVRRTLLRRYSTCYSSACPLRNDAPRLINLPARIRLDCSLDAGFNVVAFRFEKTRSYRASPRGTAFPRSAKACSRL